MFTNSCRMTYIFSSVLIFLDSEYSKEKIQHQSKEYVFLAKLKEECQDKISENQFLMFPERQCQNALPVCLEILYEVSTKTVV